MDQTKIFEYIKNYKRLSTPYGDQIDLRLAICYVQVGEFQRGQALFEMTFRSMFKDPKLWKMSGQPEWLPEICILSRRLDLLDKVNQELDEYKKRPNGDAPVPNFAYSLAQLLSANVNHLEEKINKIQQNKKYKMEFAWGDVLKAILKRDQRSFDNSLREVLIAHKGQATHGGLRWTPERWLCMSAMALSYIAYKNGLVLSVEDDYLNLGYLHFLYDF